MIYFCLILTFYQWAQGTIEHNTAPRELRTTAPFSKETHIHHSCPGVLRLIELALTNAAEAWLMSGMGE